MIRFTDCYTSYISFSRFMTSNRFGNTLNFVIARWRLQSFLIQITSLIVPSLYASHSCFHASHNYVIDALIMMILSTVPLFFKIFIFISFPINSFMFCLYYDTWTKGMSNSNCFCAEYWSFESSWFYDEMVYYEWFTVYICEVDHKYDMRRFVIISAEWAIRVDKDFYCL